MSQLGLDVCDFENGREELSLMKADRKYPSDVASFFDHMKSDDKAVFHTSQRFDPRLKK